MATYIQVDETLPYHHKFVRFCKIANCGVDAGIGYLTLFWLYVLKVAWRDGDLSAYGDELIENACFWNGEHGAMIKAMQTCGKPKEDGTTGPGFLDGYVAHNWVRRTSRLIRDRLYREERKSDGGQGAPPSAEALEILGIWNEFAKQHGLAHAARAPRLREGTTSGSFKSLLEKAVAQPFLLGNGNQKWRMDLDWLLRQENADKVASGSYKDHKEAAAAAGAPVEDHRETTRRILARRAAKAAPKP